MPPHVHYRSLRADEVPEAAQVFLTSVTDLARRNGLPPPTAYAPASVEPVYRHLRETGIFDVAEVDGRIVAICSAILRSQVWFLSMFWTLPELQRSGIGRPLLERVYAAGVARDARVFCTWSSIDFAAIGTYLKLGLLPGGPIFKLAGAPARLPAAPRGAVISEIEPDEIAALDHSVRACERGEDHAFWAARGDAAFGVRSGGRLLGYFYLDGAAIGPAAWHRDEDAGTVLVSALRAAAARAPNVQLVALGMNAAALRIGIDAGLRVAAASHFLRSAAFGALERYVPSGPALF